VPNITLRIKDEELIRRARVLAAKRGTSLSAILRDYIRELVERDENYERARKRARRQMKSGLRLGGSPLKREEIYDDQA